MTLTTPYVLQLQTSYLGRWLPPAFCNGLNKLTAFHVYVRFSVSRLVILGLDIVSGLRESKTSTCCWAGKMLKFMHIKDSQFPGVVGDLLRLYTQPHHWGKSYTVYITVVIIIIIPHLEEML